MERTEIDTRAPFKSVKEAVMLFGEKVLVGEIYANKLKEVLSHFSFYSLLFMYFQLMTEIIINRHNT